MLSMLTSVPAMANWNQGVGANSGKWWYQNEDGSYPSNSWKWIDGNNDGVAECYYFDAQGWMLANTKTPDNYDVNANGQWVVNNSVQTQASAKAKKNGIVKKTTLEAYSRPRTNGIIAVGIREGDELVTARLTNGESYMLIASKKGKVMICPEGEFRAMGRGASGVKGMDLEPEGDGVIDMLCLPSADENLLVVSEHGYGKRSSLADYRATLHRGGKGVKAMQITDKTGPLAAITNVTDEHDLMIINRSGITIRMKVADLRVLGRNTQGVKLIDLRGKDYIASITKVPTAGDDDEADTLPEGAEAENIATESNNEPATDTNNQTEE